MAVVAVEDGAISSKMSRAFFFRYRYALMGVYFTSLDLRGDYDDTDSNINNRIGRRALVASHGMAHGKHLSDHQSLYTQNCRF